MFGKRCFYPQVLRIEIHLTVSHYLLFICLFFMFSRTGSICYSLGGLLGLFVQRVLVVVTEHLEDDRLTLDVINERLCHLHREL